MKDSVENENAAPIRWNCIGDTRVHQTGHYLVDPVDMAEILESLTSRLQWEVVSVGGSVTATVNLGKSGWLQFNFFRFDGGDGDKYIMEGEGAYLSEDECRELIPTKAREILVSNKPIQYTKF